MVLYALTIFASAFLLFLVQPIMAKQILPWFGGTAAVWTTCLVFFQFLLLFGYAYSDWTTRHMKPRTQVALHVVLLVASLASLPIVAGAAWKPTGDEDPTLRILGLLGATIGLPYFLLSTTGPLVQAWFARSFPAGTVYRLFALSNFASLLALVSYPFVFEPWVTTAQQSYGWSAGYALFVALCIASAVYSVRSRPSSVPAAATLDAMNTGPVPRAADFTLWLVFSAMGSFLLLAVTNHITHDVASVPFLWILPLTIYLVTFILCFEGRGWYKRHIFLGPVLVAVAAMAWSLHEERGIHDIKESVALFSAGLFVCCMFFHGELANMKPAPRYLTSFYLMVSLGGALGGFIVGFVAPRIFVTYYEFALGLIVTLALALYVVRRMPAFVPLLVIACIGFTGYHVYHYVESLTDRARVMMRNFYGTLRVRDAGSGDSAARRLTHGVIMHGEQYLSKARRNQPTTYYGPTSGIGRAMAALGPGPKRVAVIGLGTGTLAVYGRAGDVYRFYEINPQVIDVAKREFTYLADTPASVETVLGDARLTMEREPAQNYDLIAIDAFSSDSIPVHLMTREALAVYLKHLKPGGLIAFHVTNRFLRLAPVVKAIAHEAGLASALIVDEAEESDFAKTDWILVARDAKVLARKEIASATEPVETIPGLAVWTDDYNNLFRILK
ncbi:MAG TPA: fused MFS/spermidine synthase [Burkholderiales bacterium]|nr:fused MFS/spermidine synthase [Burkholderiales bacterium]